MSNLLAPAAWRVSPHDTMPNPLAPAAWLGFDLDHCVARYKNKALMRLVYASLCAALAELGHFSAATFVGGWDAAAIVKGAVFDFTTGYLLLLDASGRVAAARRGATRATAADIEAAYPGTAFWGAADLAHRRKHPGFFALTTYFDMPAQLVLCQIVAAQLAATGGELPPEWLASLRGKVLDAFNHIFDNVAAWGGRGAFFTAVRNEPGTYLVRRRRLGAWLRSARAAGRFRTFLATNSHLEFALFTLGYTLGPDWRDCFDLVCFDAHKPVFFDRPQPFLPVDLGSRSIGEVPATAVPLKLAPGAGGAPLFANGCAPAVQALADAHARVAGSAVFPCACCSPAALVLHVGADGSPVPCARRAGAAGGTPGAGNTVHPDPEGTASHEPVIGSLQDAEGEEFTSASEEAGVTAAAAASHASSSAGRAHIAYFGDYIQADVVAAVEGAGWAGVAVVEELEGATPPARLQQASPLQAVIPAVTAGEELNFPPEDVAGCQWGDFFTVPSSDCSPAAGFFWHQVTSHACAAVADVEEALCTLFPQFAPPAEDPKL